MIAIHGDHFSRTFQTDSPTMRLILLFTWLTAISWLASDSLAADPQSQAISFQVRLQQPTQQGSSRYHVVHRAQSWSAAETAVIVCDVWDAHTSVNAVRRVNQIAPRINDLCNTLREKGATIIHAPSGCMDTYAETPARQRAIKTPAAENFPDDIGKWCYQIPAEEQGQYPLDQSDGGRDDEPHENKQWTERIIKLGRNPNRPWQAQCSVVTIDQSQDYISDNGNEVWSILAAKNIDNVIMVGVHTNMCVLGRPFGLRRLASNGKNVVLVRDLTDTMYNPAAWPYASHFSGTDLIVSHIERHVCPTITSDQVLGGEPIRFANDQRTRLVMLVAEDEYKTNETLPAFAAKHLTKHFSVTILHGSETERHSIPGMWALDDADALLISARRRALPEADLKRIEAFVAAGKPVIGIRTANHAFSLRGKPSPTGTETWESFDADVFGGNYTNHFGNGLKSTLKIADSADHPIIKTGDIGKLAPSGSLYRVKPLADGTRVLLEGSLEDGQSEPVAWTFIRGDAGRSFYTSLGHENDFSHPEFQTFLAAAIHWACDQPLPSLETISAQNQRYNAARP